ncbi:hypothetical protein [Actinocorallia populi]|uniref:hypothetical protein n=1 Tax=Actinocorallia populi TaxID=2079200 RepID=UPI000D093D1C|nr:hypothetical protein [Actinocorallia populi]
MRYVMWQVVGMVLLVLGAQGGIRLLADRDDAGLLGPVADGFAPLITGYVVIALAGALLAGWGASRTKKAG